MDCQEAQVLLVPWLEDELAPAEGELLSEHVDRCGGCAELAGALAEQGDALAAIKPPPDPRLSDDAFWSRMETTLDTEWRSVRAERDEAAARAGSLRGRLTAGLGRPDLRVSPVGVAAYAAALLLAFAWGWLNLSEAQTAQAEVRALEAELTDLERGSRVAIEPRTPPRVEAYRTVSHTPRRGTL